MSDLFGTEQSAAVISECGLYRYRLTRTWDYSLRRACFLMLNPSTADASVDDPTIKRCKSFAAAWGAGGIEVVNLFAWRATDPDVLPTVADPVGPDNDRYIRAALEQCRPIVAAWGAGATKLKRREAAVLEIIRRVGVDVMCLGTTKGGHPLHPLYIPASRQLRPFEVPAEGKP